jgi:hypothetical protein
LILITFVMKLVINLEVDIHKTTVATEIVIPVMNQVQPQQ